jgi:hypothetical protein
MVLCDSRKTGFGRPQSLPELIVDAGRVPAGSAMSEAGKANRKCKTQIGYPKGLRDRLQRPAPPACVYYVAQLRLFGRSRARVIWEE